MTQKRGQVMLFIVIALIVIIIIIFVTRLKVIPRLVPLAPGAEVVRDYVGGCIDIVTKNGLRTMGLGGGYIGIPDDFIPRSAVNVFSNSLLLGGNEVMYWYYKSVNNLDIVNVPEKNLMEEQLSRYISDNLKNCLNKFEGFRYAGYKVESGDAKVNALIKDRNVDVNVDMPVLVVIGDTSSRIESFSVSVKSNFGRLYNLGKEIIDANSEYLEELTFDTISLDEEIPLSDTEFDCQQRRWEKNKIEMRLKNLLSRNIPAVKLRGSDYSSVVDEYYLWDALKSNYKDASVNLLYLESWPLYLKVEPSENGVLKSDDIIKQEDGAKFLSGLFCIQNWNFVYNIKYPVLITLNSGDDILQFGYMVVIENNQPKKNTLAKDDFGEFKEEFCDKKLGQVNIGVSAAKDGSLINIPDADVFFKCFNFECSVGKSDFNGLFSGKVPQCINGFMIARKEGYFEGKLPVNSNQITSGTVKLEPLFELNLDVALFDGATYRRLSGNEKATFELRHLDKDFSTSVIYPDVKSIKLIAGRYNISSSVISRGQEISIPGESVERCANVPAGLLGIFGFEKEKCESIELPELKLNEIVVGGNTNLIDIPRNQLLNGRTITLYSYYYGAPQTIGDYESVYEKINSNKLETGYELK